MLALARRVVAAAAAVTAFVLYMWYRAVRLAPLVKRRKAMRRRGIVGRD
ncbi:MAG TPA: hypothetical protein VLW05_04180 [Gaiellaceae bacterium]|nr:hypothetical protein [Gaiellaceae bacterium]